MDRWQTIIEPFRIHSVEPIRMTTRGRAAPRDRRGRAQPVQPPRRRRPRGPAHRFRDRGDEPRPVGRDPARRRVVCGLALLVRLPGGRAGALPVRARHPDPPGARGREDPVLGHRRTGQGDPEQHPLRHDPGERRGDRRRGGRPRDRGRPPSRGRAPVQGQHGPRPAGGRFSRLGAPTCRPSSSRSRTTRAAASPSAWRTCAGSARCATGSASRSSSTPAGSPRTPGSSSCASQARASGACPEIVREIARSPTA